ncbi:SYP112 [Linum grandiflorum]
MTDLMAKSFMNYVELKKQSSSPDLEKGEPRKEDDFMEKVKSIKAEMEQVAKLIRATARKEEGMVSDRSVINSQHIISVLRKAKNIKTTLEWLQKCNPEQGSVTNELRGKLREIVQDLIAVSLEITSIVPEGEIMEEEEEESKEELEELLVEMRVLVESNNGEEIRSSSSSIEEQGVKEGGGIWVLLVERMKEQRKNYKCWVGLFLLLVLFILLVSFAP